MQHVFDPLSGPLRHRNRRRNPLWRFRRLFFVVGLLAVAGVGAVLYVFSRTELPEDRFEEIAQTSYLCTAEVARDCGPENSAALLSAPGEDRDVVTYDQLPENLIEAVVATEDQDFFNHRGIDPRGITRAAYRYVRGQGVVQGGSTITQQYVKLAFGDAERNLTRKMREAMRAIKLEQDLTEECADRPDLGGQDPRLCAKQIILERYLNRAYFGRGASGVAAAARAYFDKDLAALTVAESAFLSGLLRNPNGADPETMPDQANRRRSSSIQLMLRAGFITPEEAAAAEIEPWVVAPRIDREGLGEVAGSQFGTEYFVEEVRLQLDEIYTNGEINRGLRVYTTLRQDMQQAAYETIYAPREEDLEARGFPDMGNTWLDPANPIDPQAALISLDAEGRVLAMVGGHSFDQSEFNLATSSGGESRQAGSTFKTFALATAIQQGISARSFYPALPGKLEIGGICADNGKPWDPSGGGSPQYRYRDLIDALTVSSNVVFAELVVDIGPDQLREVAQDMGIRSSLQVPNNGNPFTPCSLVLGSQGVPVIDMASAYSTFERAGVRKDPILIERVEDVTGRVICWYPVDGRCQEGPDNPDEAPGRPGEQVLDPAIARQVNYALTQVVGSGTGRRAALADRLMAGKTGTSQKSRDAWFAGFTCDLTTVVWMGYSATEQPMYDFRKPLPEDGQIPVDENGDPIDDPNWRNVEGGNFPSFLWNDYMERVTAGLPPCESLEVQEDFPGTRLNQDLSTSTLPPCGVELDQYGFPKGSRPEDFIIITTTTAAAQPPPAQPDGGNQGLPRQDDGTTSEVAGVNCIPLNDWQAQSSTTGGVAPTGPDGSPPSSDPDQSSTTGQSTTATTPTSTIDDGGVTSTTDPAGPSTASLPPVSTAPLPTIGEPAPTDNNGGNNGGNNGNGDGRGNG